MKFFLLKRKLLTLGASLLCAAAMFYIVSHPAVIGAAGAARQLPIYCVQRDQKVVSLSFDAAWGDVILRRGSAAGGIPAATLLAYPLYLVGIHRICFFE